MPAGSPSETYSALTWEKGVKVATSPCPAHGAFDGDVVAWGRRMLGLLPPYPSGDKRYYLGPGVMVPRKAPL